MGSIQKKIITIIVISILTMSLLLLSIDIYLTNEYASRNAETVLTRTCTAQALKVDSMLKATEKSVTEIAMLSQISTPDISEFSNSEIVKSYTDSLLSSTIRIAELTEGALAVYFRINPELDNTHEAGFFLVKSPITENFELNDVTDITAYDRDDKEHVGWYYAPVDAGEPVWMEPYHNKNIDIEMISYVTPIYKNDTLLGVIGMDIDFNNIMRIVSDVNLFESGSIKLLELNEKTIYMHTKADNVLFDKPDDTLYEEIVTSEAKGKISSFSYLGSNHLFTFGHLANGMVLIAHASTAELFSLRDNLIMQSLIITAVILIIILFIMIRITKRIISPIKEITEVTKQYAKGNWEAELKCDTNDELKILSESIISMADKTRKYISDINAMAYIDALTGLKNKSKYMEFAELAKENAKNGASLALVSLDLNRLKYVNDTFGHDAGDKLICDAAKTICKYFAHSPVFRFGGDEFFVIMETDDYTNRNEIIKRFQEKMFEASGAEDSMTVVIASGMASIPDDTDDYEEAFRIADQRMYENKTALKKKIK